jgi:dolichyl-phosphate-mannose--protein O-mannosyl transferase
MKQYSYNLDEGTVLEMFQNFKPGELNFDTKNYVSGTLGYYLFAGAIFIGSVMGFYDLVPDPDYYREHITELRYMYIAMRLLTVLFSTLLILVSFHIGKHIIGDELGLLLAGYISFMPSILANSQYASVQLTLLVSIALSFLFLLRYLKNYKNKDLYLLALFCGLSISIKHSGIFTFVLLGYAFYHVRKQKGLKDWLKTIVILSAIIMMTFTATSPYLVKFRLFQLFMPDVTLDADHTGFMWNFDILNMPAFTWQIIKVYFFETGIISVFFFYLLMSRNINRFILPVLLFIVTFHTAVLFTMAPSGPLLQSSTDFSNMTA